MKIPFQPSFQVNDKIKTKNAISVAVNPFKKSVEFYSIENFDKNTIVYKSVEFSSKLYSDEFYGELTNCVKNLASFSMAKEDCFVTVILPDNAVCVNTVNVPNINRRKNEEAVNATINGLYKNLSQLTVNKFLATQSKQLATYSLTAINNKTVRKITQSFTEGGLVPNGITFYSNALINAIGALSQQLKSESYLYLDLKLESSTFVFVANGRATGFFPLPFGYSNLIKPKLVQEDMLFEHSVAELAVLNSKEKAKAKQLTTMSNDENEEDSEDSALDAMFGEEEGTTPDPTSSAPVNIKSLPKKQPRKLPKFMQRPIPNNDDDIAYENFRIFVKWALNLIASNDKLIMQGNPKAVYVNMPNELDFLYDKVNFESAENGIEFLPFDKNGISEKIISSLELYGGLYSSQMNKTNTFML